jgi:Fe(3+) dicitrate transport protein
MAYTRSLAVAVVLSIGARPAWGGDGPTETSTQAEIPGASARDRPAAEAGTASVALDAARALVRGDGAEAVPPEASEAEAPPTDTATVAAAPVEAAGSELSVWVGGKRRARARVAGSAHLIDAETLQRFANVDVQRALTAVPGVYVRNEDGFGLRPNIGLRGAISDRSAKITMMEDGVLISPAPYSANAAYYFPMMLRMAGLEVWKGPAAVRFGPSTIGGAVNVLTRPIPRDGLAGDLRLGLGAYRFGELAANVGWGSEHFGFLVDGAHLRTAGFKELDGGGDTGFERSDLMLKARLNTARQAPVVHTLEAKFVVGDERSNETYLGLTDADFAATPNRRYAASQLDHMAWTRTQLQLAYVLKTPLLTLTTTGYRIDLHRAWKKLNRFADGAPALLDLLAAPGGTNAVYYEVLTGRRDSDPAIPSLTLQIGTNDRTFVSQGVQSVARFAKLDGLGLAHRIELGVRVHQDQIRRYQYEDPHQMAAGTLVPFGDRVVNTDELGSVLAFSAHAYDEIRVGELTLVPGARLEAYRAEMTGAVTDNAGVRDVVAAMPGLGAHYQLTPWLGVLGGVHSGFAPVAPGQAATARPERSLNVEAGLRLALEPTRTRAELIGFFSSYSNLVGECTVASGCEEKQQNAQISAGGAEVGGVEVSAGQDVALAPGWRAFGELAYTLTASRFLVDPPQVGYPLFVGARAGDELPYLPLHQGALTIGLDAPTFDVALTSRAIARMRDRYSPGAPEGDFTEGYVVFDAAASYALGPGRITLRGENLTNTAYLSSRRPFGARPGLPLFVGLGYRVHFGS